MMAMPTRHQHVAQRLFKLDDLHHHEEGGKMYCQALSDGLQSHSNPRFHSTEPDHHHGLGDKRLTRNVENGSTSADFTSRTILSILIRNI
jgi:hypothetical protein